MKTNVVLMYERFRLGDRFTVFKGHKICTFQVMAMDVAAQGHKHTYWVSQVVELKKKVA